MTTMNRRDFLAVAAASTLPSLVLGRELVTAERIPIVDTHQHLWDLRKFKLAWQKEPPYSKLTRNYLLPEYITATEGLPVVKTIYMEVDAPTEHRVTEAECISGLCHQQDNRLVAAVIGGRPASDHFAEYLARFKENRCIKGVRDILFETPERCLDPPFLRGVRLLGELGMSFDIETSATGLVHATKLAAACRETQFILDHCGNPNIKSGDITKWKHATAKMAKEKNVVVKISGILSGVEKDAWGPEDLVPAIDHLWNEFGPDRMIFGSDWPVVTLKASYRQWVDALRQVVAKRSLADQRKLFHDNAVKLYDLS